MLGGGGMEECPGSCYATNAVNLPIEYKATTGGNYWACQIPGVWKSQQAAGIAAVACADSPSIALGTELSGDIYKNGGEYSFTLATPGSAAASPFDPSAIPAGSSYVGNYHTHGADDPGYLNEMFSQAGCNGGRPCDIGLANSAANKGNPVYLGTPQGRVEVYYPGALGLPYGCVLIGIAVAPGSESSVAIPVCH